MPQMSVTVPPVIASDSALAAVEEFFRLRAHGIGQHDQELAAAAGAEQQPRELQFRQQGARNDFADQRDPEGSRG